MAKMKLAAIYNVWDDWQLLYASLDAIQPITEGQIVVYSVYSNYGEGSNAMLLKQSYPFVTFVQCEPNKDLTAAENERRKRQIGLETAEKMGFTHFLMMDADEFYEPEPFLKEKNRIEQANLNGLVCRTKVYFRSPTLTIGLDRTLVPFITKITPNLRFAMNFGYPFAWSETDGKPFTEKKSIRIDPTRQLTYTMGIEWSEIIMHHYSWVRSDVQKKVRNSTARQNIEQSTIIRDYADAKAGAYCQFYKATLEACDNLFNIPAIEDVSII